MTDQDDNLDMQSPDIVNQNVEKLAELFPNCVTESADGKAIDFDLLKQELSDQVVEGTKERYRLEWPGKREAIVTANTPTNKTLRPVREESVDFDNTENLYIEGDNLEVLKLLQESYLGKVKMIYIDPPYNTGKDFVYNDNFRKDAHQELIASGQKDEADQRLIINPETAGRYHSDWLSMMYPRLKLARNLLSSNGTIFISINDVELNNLKKICDEIFGQDNFIGNIVWKNVTDNNPSNIAIEHEYILVFSKSRSSLEPLWKSKISDIKKLLIDVGDDLTSKYSNQEELQAHYSAWFKKHKSELWPLENYKYIDSEGVYSGERGVHNPGKEGYRYDIIHPVTKLPCKQPLMGYRFPESTMKSMIESGRIIFGSDEKKLVEIKVYAKDYLQKLSSVLNLDGRSGANELKEIFPEAKKVFTNPKTINLLTELISFATKGNDIVFDFFGGSGSTAHAVLKLNSETNEKRRFISVQLQEKNYTQTNQGKVPKIGAAGDAFNAGFLNISEIHKERIRRAAKKIQAETSADIDYGFRVYRLDESNMQDVYYHPQDYDQTTVELFEDNVKSDRTPDDLLAQVMLDWGLPLSLKIEQETVEDKRLFKVAENSLYACFDKGIDENFAKAIAEEQPLRIVFRDAGFKDDTAKTNVKQLLKQLSPNTEMKVL